MKTKITLIILAVLIQIVSCKKDEDPSINLDKTDITLQHNSTSQLVVTPTQTCTWSIADSNVAKVSAAGLVTGVRIGDSKITVKTSGTNLSAECIVHVTARSFLYKEPFYVYGQLMSYVKGKETRALKSETSTALLYNGENANVRYVMYMFTSNAMTSADVMLANTTGNVDAAVTFLEERYIFVGYVDNVAFYKDGKGTFAGLNVDATLGLNVLYYNGSGKKNSNVDFDEYLKVLNKFKSLK